MLPWHVFRTNNVRRSFLRRTRTADWQRNWCRCDWRRFFLAKLIKRYTHSALGYDFSHISCFHISTAIITFASVNVSIWTLVASAPRSLFLSRVSITFDDFNSRTLCRAVAYLYISFTQSTMSGRRTWNILIDVCSGNWCTLWCTVHTAFSCYLGRHIIREC